jgi:hypothetical protein
MKKKFRIGQMKQQVPAKYSPEWTASYVKQAMSYLTPLIIDKNIPATEAIVLIAAYTDYLVNGKERAIPEDFLMKACQLILMLWEEGTLIPESNYPYTLEQTLTAWNKESEEAEGESEAES